MTGISLSSEWKKIQHTVDQIELQLKNTASPTPTMEMCKLLIAGEDHRFYYHPGVDPFALCRAVWRTIFCNYRQGASTIAMQLVRTITGRYEKTLMRKFHEVILAIRLTQYVDKERLPILYLWVAYYGWRMNNFSQACLRLEIYPPATSEYETAKLVARLKYPEPRQQNASRSAQIHRRARHLVTLINSDKTPGFLCAGSNDGAI